MDTKTLQKYSPPGYFDLSGNQTEATKKTFDWFLNYKDSLRNEANHFDFFYRLFLSVDYTSEVSKDFLLFVCSQYGLADIVLTANKMKNLLIHVSTPRARKLSDNIQRLIDFLFLQEWISDFGGAVVGFNSRSNFAEAFIIYSTSVSMPPTPDNTGYLPLEWVAPASWGKIPSHATFYSRGYLYEGEIIWCNPLPTDTVVRYDIVDNLLALPLSPDEGDIALVVDDDTMDFQSVYYYDGFYWLKNSTPNANQKNVNIVPAQKGSEVFAPPDPLITSMSIPPNDGYSEGYGFYGIFGQGTLVNKISFVIILTEEGYNNLGLIVQLIKKIKPVGNILIVYAIYLDTTYLLEINDANAP